MYHTEPIDDQTTLSKWFEWLDKHRDKKFRENALEAFRQEMVLPYNPQIGCTYYAVYDDEQELILIKTTLFINTNPPSIAISFSRIFYKIITDTEHKVPMWLVNALNDKIFDVCDREGIKLITARIKTTGGLRVFKDLRNMLITSGIRRVRKIENLKINSTACIELK